jgi:hypothetical protein
MDRKLVGPQNRSGRSREGKILVPAVASRYTDYAISAPLRVCSSENIRLRDRVSIDQAGIVVIFVGFFQGMKRDN